MAKATAHRDATEAAGRRRALGEFLETRRARLRPADVGLPAGPRRRVPGLRREEVAQLADVGVTWYTWLEQGRAISPSDSVLLAIAAALRLDAAERRHLLELARPEAALDGARGDGSAGAGDARAAERAAELDALVRTFGDTPAYAVDGRWDVLACNDAAAALLPGIAPGPDGAANLMRVAFTDPAWRRLLVDWEAEAARHVALYRTAMVRHLDDPAWTDLPVELTGSSPDFARVWAAGDVAAPETRTKRFRMPDGGERTLLSTVLLLADEPAVRVVVLQPAG